LTVNELVDQTNDRLRTEELTRVQDNATAKQRRIGGGRTTVLTFLPPFSTRIRRLLSGQARSKKESVIAVGDTLSVTRSQLVRLPTNTTQGEPILRIHEMKVARANVDLSLELHHGDRIGIQGSSGIGKSQILRTLAGLEALDRSSLVFMGTAASDVSMPEWRRRIALLSQDRPSLQGTPREFYEQVCRFQSQQQQLRDNNSLGNGDGRKDPAMLAAEWGLAESAFDQPWSTLSGGESQRACLAIALALEPEVLLLDESTSALDEQATLQVEDTLKRLVIPIVMVSHDTAQVDRFCNRRIDLGTRVQQVL
jgi:ABC-type iron transport system FetAB ATPase subunit